MATVNELEQALVNADKAGDEAAAKVLAQALQDARAGQQVSPQPTDRQQFMTSWYGRLMRGLQDPVDAGAQMLVRGAAKVFPSLESEVSRVDEMVKGDAQEYEQARAAAGQSGFDLNRTLGSTALQLLALRGLPVPAAGASLGARTALGAASGAGYGAMQPVTEGDFWTEKVRQTGLGAATGAAAAPLTGALARVIRPKVPEGVQALRAAGVYPTPGQVKGGIFKSAEERLSSVPLIGDAIKAGQMGAVEELNVAAWNRALAPLGQRLPKNVTGQRAVAFVDDTIDDAYRSVIDKIGAKPIDSKLMQDLYGLRDLLGNASQDAKASFGNFIKTQVSGKLSNGRYLTGEKIKGLEEQLGRYARDMTRSNSAAERQLGQAYREAQASLREWLARVSPEQAGKLRAVNTAYANFLRPLRASGYLGVQDETFTAAQLHNAVRALDPSKHKKAFARGDALMQDLSQPAKDVLTNRVPNSGTTDRALLAYLLTNPVKGITAGATALPVSAMYTPLGRRTMAALGSRPEFAEPLAEVVRRSVPLVGPGLYGLLGQE